MKKIVVYYSISGHTRAVAKRIAAKLRTKAVEIRTEKTYPDDYDVLESLGKKEVEIGYMPKIYPMDVDFSKYDAIIIGMPVWWSTYAPAVKTFLASVKWKGKMVYPFATNGGSLGHTPSDLKKALRGAMVYPPLSVCFDGATQVTPAEAVNHWIAAIAEDGYEDE